MGLPRIVCILERRKVVAPGSHNFEVDRRGQHAFAFAGIRDDHPMRIYDHASPGIQKAGLHAHAIHADHIGLVFDRPRLQQSQPMLLSFRGPERHDHEEIRALARGGAKDLGEAQIVADERRHRETGHRERDDFLTAFVGRLAALRREEFDGYRREVDRFPADRFETWGLPYHRNRYQGRPQPPAVGEDGVLRGIGCSAGSACQSGSITPSHVLSAIGVEPDLASSAIRMSLGSLTTDACIDRVAEVFPALVNKARGASQTVS